MLDLSKHGGELLVLSEQAYAKEAVLQQTLAEHPRYRRPSTAGAEDRKLLLVKKEMGVPGAASGTDV